MEKYIPSLVKEDLYKILVPKLEILDENMTEVRQRMTSLSPDEWKNLHDYLLVPEIMAVQFEKQREAAAHGKPEGYYRLIFDLVTRELKMARDFLGMPPFEPKK